MTNEQIKKIQNLAVEVWNNYQLTRKEWHEHDQADIFGCRDLYVKVNELSAKWNGIIEVMDILGIPVESDNEILYNEKTGEIVPFLVNVFGGNDND